MMPTRNGEPLYSGKAKTLYLTENAQYLTLSFRDDTSAFDGEKTEKLARKGRTNNYFNAFIMKKLTENGIPTHFEEILSDTESRVKHLHMLPIECVVRNIAAGSLCRRLGIEQGINLDPAIFEFFLKNDELKDPPINRSHINTFGWAADHELERMEELSHQVNDILSPLFKEAGMLLVDYKLEFGRFQGKIYLGDEFTPDGCRIWDINTRESLDKDRFRKDLGGVIEGYEQVAQRLGVPLGETAEATK